jgi:lysophospholipase L1-like esterase
LHAGRGFFDDQREFTSPFFTTYAEPMPFQTRTSYNFLNDYVPRKKSSTEVRIICFGGSTTVNFRAGISYAEILNNKFATYRKGYQVKVLNASSDGYSSAHTLVNFSLRNLDVQPDIITVYHNINDLSAVWVGDRIFSDYGNKYKTDFYLGMRHRTGFLAELAKISRLSRFIISKINALEFPTYKEYHDRDYTLGLEYFKRNLKNIVTIAKTHGIRVVLASQPAASEFRSHQGFVDYNKTIELLANEMDVTYIDLATALTDDQLFLSDNIHYTQEGVKRIAEIFYEPLADIIDEIINIKISQDIDEAK